MSATDDKAFWFFMINEEAKGVDETEETSINAESIEILKIHCFLSLDL